MYIYIARQPIFDAAKRVKGYELLYRSSEANAFDYSISGDKATRLLLSRALLDFGLKTITDGRKAYINLTESLIVHNFPALLDRNVFVLEILEDVKLQGEVVKRLKEFRERGYLMALDDYCGCPVEEEALDLMDIIKIDFMNTTPETRHEIAVRMRKEKKILLAEKVETEQDFVEGISLGCRLFQGYYLSRPLVMKKEARQISQASAAKLFQIVAHGDYAVQDLARIINLDAHLTYKLLQRMRTARYYRGKTVQSVPAALVRMGMDEVRRWVTLVLMQSMTEDEGSEQVSIALARAVFCEKQAGEGKNHQLSQEAFTAGMFSILDGNELKEILSILEVSESVMDALVNHKDNEIYRFIQTAKLYENCQWDELLKLYQSQQIAKLQGWYEAAISYANDALSTPAEK